MRRRLTFVTVFSLLLSGIVLAGTFYAGNALVVGDASAQVTFASTECNGGVCSSVTFDNTGSNSVYIKLFHENETIAAVTVGVTAGLFVIPAGKIVDCAFDRTTEPGRGYIGFARIGPGGGLATTLDVVGK